MSKAEVNGRAFFLQALMSSKNKCHIKERLLKHFGWALLPASCPLREHSLSNTAYTLGSFCPFVSLLFTFPPIPPWAWDLPAVTQTHEIGRALPCSPSALRGPDLHWVQTATTCSHHSPSCPCGAPHLPLSSAPHLSHSLPHL